MTKYKKNKIIKFFRKKNLSEKEKIELKRLNKLYWQAMPCHNLTKNKDFEPLFFFE